MNINQFTDAPSAKAALSVETRKADVSIIRKWEAEFGTISHQRSDERVAFMPLGFEISGGQFRSTEADSLGKWTVGNTVTIPGYFCEVDEVNGTPKLDADNNPILIKKTPQGHDIDPIEQAIVLRAYYGPGGRRARKGKDRLIWNGISNHPKVTTTRTRGEGQPDQTFDYVDFNALGPLQRILTAFWIAPEDIEGITSEELAAMEKIRADVDSGGYTTFTTNSYHDADEEGDAGPGNEVQNALAGLPSNDNPLA